MAFQTIFSEMEIDEKIQNLFQHDELKLTHNNPHTVISSAPNLHVHINDRSFYEYHQISHFFSFLFLALYD